MFIVYLILGGLFGWLTIISFSAAFSFGGEDEHALFGDDDFKRDELAEGDWKDEEELDSDEDWRGESESSSSWCPEELTERVE